MAVGLQNVIKLLVTYSTAIKLIYRKRCLADALSAIKEIDQQAEQQLLRSYLRGVVHGYCEPESVELLELTLASNEAGIPEHNQGIARGDSRRPTMHRYQSQSRAAIRLAALAALYNLIALGIY